MMLWMRVGLVVRTSEHWNIAKVLGSIPAPSDTGESDGAVIETVLKKVVQKNNPDKNNFVLSFQQTVFWSEADLVAPSLQWGR